MLDTHYGDRIQVVGYGHTIEATDFVELLNGNQELGI